MDYIDKIQLSLASSAANLENINIVGGDETKTTADSLDEFLNRFVGAFESESDSGDVQDIESDSDSRPDSQIDDDAVVAISDSSDSDESESSLQEVDIADSSLDESQEDEAVQLAAKLQIK